LLLCLGSWQLLATYFTSFPYFGFAGRVFSCQYEYYMMTQADIEKLLEFDNHKLVRRFEDKDSGLRGYVAIHRTIEGHPSLGATRLWSYRSETEALCDSLRLSRLMSYKSALAGLPYGGAKAVLIATPNMLKHRADAFRAYAEKINYLGGQFVTGTDVGVEDKDISLMQKTTDFVIGTKVDPAYYTAISVTNAIEVALNRISNQPELGRRKFAIQGVGKTGSNILKLLYKNSAVVYIADIDKQKLKAIKKKFPRVKVVNPSDIHKQEVDVFIPCALSGVLNSKNIKELRCSIVAGSANNQLNAPSAGDLLYKRGILYAPDYASNAGGLISVADELENKRPSKERILSRIEKVRVILENIFEEGEKKKIPTNIVANKIAEKIFNGKK